MKQSERAQLRQKLLDLRDGLEQIEGSLRDAGKTVELDQARVGRLSRMDAMQGQQMAIEAGRRSQAQLLKIEGALRRLDSGDYGDCFVCGDEIDLRRLQADPTITRCLDCMEE